MRAESEHGARSMEFHGCYRRLLLENIDLIQVFILLSRQSNTPVASGVIFANFFLCIFDYAFTNKSFCLL